MSEFTTELDRSGTSSIKWSLIQDIENPSQWLKTDDYFGADRTLPMWVADMDFRSPEAVVKAIEDRAKHGVFGYTGTSDSYLNSIVDWMKRRHDWKIKPDWIVTTPGVVPALHMLVQALTENNDNVVIQQPVYYPFFSAIKENGRNLISNSLIVENGNYSMDFEDLEKVTANPQTKLIILCNPHNPVGRVWTVDELLQFGNICRKNNVIVVADEIHGDLVFKRKSFTPFASLEDFGDFTITCTAPSKTFNLAGLQTSNLIIENSALRLSFQKILRCNGLMGGNTFGLVACEAAYNHGEEWLDKLLAVLTSNLDYMEDYFSHHFPSFDLIRPQGTYLAWFDCNRLGLDHKDLRKKFMAEAKIFLDDGSIFGAEGNGFQRINIACPRAILEDAMQRVKNTFF